LVVSVIVGQQTVCERWPGQAFRDDKGIVAQCFKEFLQYLWLFGVPGHAIHFSL
jgi:hypothetical protein